MITKIFSDMISRIKNKFKFISAGFLHKAKRTMTHFAGNKLFKLVVQLAAGVVIN